MSAAACCSGSRFPLGAAERSPQDFTLFLINYSHDLSANVREGAALDNTCEEFTVFLLYLLRTFKLLLGMFLRDFVPKINWIFLFLDLLGVFVADKDNNWINVNAVEPFNGVRGNVEQTVTTLVCYFLYGSNSGHIKMSAPALVVDEEAVFDAALDGLLGCLHHLQYTSAELPRRFFHQHLFDGVCERPEDEYRTGRRAVHLLHTLIRQAHTVIKEGDGVRADCVQSHHLFAVFGAAALVFLFPPEKGSAGRCGERLTGVFLHFGHAVSAVKLLVHHVFAGDLPPLDLLCVLI